MRLENIFVGVSDFLSCTPFMIELIFRLMNRNIMLGFLLLGIIQGVIAQPAEIKITGQVTDCAQDSLLFFFLDGSMLRPMAKLPMQLVPDSSRRLHAFNLTLKNDFPHGFYLIGNGQPQGTRMLILGNDPEVSIQGSCPTLSQSTLGLSRENVLLDQALTENRNHQQRFNQLVSQYRVAMRRKQDLSPLDSAMKVLDEEKMKLYEAVKIQSPFAAKVLGMSTYLSYQTFGQKGENEASYYANQSFRLVDFSDPDYNLIPQVQDVMRSYAQSVGKLGLSFDELKAAVGKWLGQMPTPGRTHKTALIGLANGFLRSNEDAFVYYVDRYIELYGKENPSLTQQLSDQAKPLRYRTIGALAPDIALPTPEGDTISLSSLKGKVVMVDFWASWCGPCRRENPNVRRVYAAYKDKGFEILGVSLDSSKDRWVQAIAKDQLPWYHVSDLKKWKSVASRAYGVGSIPFTVLLDAEGKIIAKGLRGAKLEAKLEELLGT